MDGEDLEIGFNHRCLYEALKAVKDEKILVKLENPVKPLIILPYKYKDEPDKGIDVDGCKFLYVVSPSRMQD